MSSTEISPPRPAPVPRPDRQRTSATQANGRSTAKEQPLNHQVSQCAAGEAAPKLTVPARPTLAPGVRLAGQMRESAFKNPPWLIERGGAGYVQVTELLYRIAELCDGRRTLAEIAQTVSERTARSVSEENVRLLLGTQLVLKGLVPSGDGHVFGGQGGSRSLLALSLRTKMISPELLYWPTAVLRWLFFPPVLIATVMLALAGLGWLLLVHGLAAGAREALYTPGLLLIALGLTAIAAGFHELGHAAALRYGGGQPKGMGVGLYLVYPAFYTDVSDNYRLGRWARVRTDLGGVYFHLIFVLGILGLYALTGWEPVLVGVPLLLLDAFRQLLPLIRLDGYWTLADLTGVPDFLSHVGAFVKHFLPGKHESSSLPELKWWGTAAFALYIVLVLPVLAFMLFTMVRTTPTILATAWDSARQLWDGLHQAQANGDLLAMASSMAQLLVLALPTAGLLYSLGRFGTRIGRTIWCWSSPTPTRRVVGALGTLGTLGLVAYLWAPQLPLWNRTGPLYEPTRASFIPLPAETRGTLFDAVGAPPPRWTASSPSDEGQPLAAPSPEPLPPGEGVAPASGSPAPAATSSTAVAPTTRPAATAAAPTVTPTDAAPPSNATPAVRTPTAAVPRAPAAPGAPGISATVTIPQPTPAAPVPTGQPVMAPPPAAPTTMPTTTLRTQPPSSGGAPAPETPAPAATQQPAGGTPTAVQTPTTMPSTAPNAVATPTPRLAPPAAP